MEPKGELQAASRRTLPNIPRSGSGSVPIGEHHPYHRGCGPRHHPPLRRRGRCRRRALGFVRTHGRDVRPASRRPFLVVSSRALHVPESAGALRRSRGLADRSGAHRRSAGSAHDADRGSGTVCRLGNRCQRPCAGGLDRRIREPGHLGRGALCETGAAALRGCATHGRGDMVARTRAVGGHRRVGGRVRRAPARSPPDRLRSTGGPSSRGVTPRRAPVRSLERLIPVTPTWPGPGLRGRDLSAHLCRYTR
jgi:hypothetical protein